MRARSLLEELGLDLDAARVGIEAWRTEMLAGNVDAAEDELRRSYETLEARGEKYTLSTVAGLLGQTILERDGPLQEAELMCERSRELASDGDIATQALWRCVQGRIVAREGHAADAEAVVREALAILEPTDATVLKLDAYLDLGGILAAAGRTSEARAAYETARELADEKGGVVTLGAVIRHIEGLDTAQV